MSKVTALLFLCTYITVTISQISYPPSWDQFCIVSNSTEFINITCNLKPGDLRLVLKDLNNYTYNTADNVKYSVYWNCSPGASVSMRLPMQINKLYRLKVMGCHVFNSSDDWNDQSLGNIKDSIVYQEIVDCVFVVNLTPILRALDNLQYMSNDFICGPDTTIKESISRNISFVVEPNPTEKQNNKDLEIIQNILTKFPNYLSPDTPIADLFKTKFIQRIVDFEYKPNCNFQRLEVLEFVWTKLVHFIDLKIYFESVKTKYPNMRVFNFSHNEYERFNEDWMKNMFKFPNLKTIDCSYNSISDVSTVKNFWINIPDRHVVLDIRYNNITTLTAETVRTWTNHPDITLNIRGNPLDCGCFKQDFINKVQDDTFFNGKMQKYKYIQNMTCASPETAKGIKIINLSKADMGCEIPPDDLTIYLVVLGIAAILLLVIILLFKFRKEIKLFLYVRFNVLLPWDVDKMAEEKRFDAFISYSSSDSDWVVDNLMHTLETPVDSHDAFSLCIHERDFIGGKSILLNIIDSIENSRHTIVVLSRHFVRSVWSMAEFKEAYEESVTEKRRHLIIVKYEDIPEAEMDSLLNRCIKTFTYIDVKDPKFIDRLRYSLAIKSR